MLLIEFYKIEFYQVIVAHLSMSSLLGVEDLPAKLSSCDLIVRIKLTENKTRNITLNIHLLSTTSFQYFSYYLWYLCLKSVIKNILTIHHENLDLQSLKSRLFITKT